MKPSKLCGLGNTLGKQQKRKAEEMELTQSNPQINEENLDGDDDDIMEVFPNENTKGVTNLEGDEEVTI